ncbi:hypothetical protein [Microvirgula aerodenitrificans]|uniref:hypothetical protein n=1 Tax=Microvirgula aerodenitrificans TaxID=57480 RepID=UPI00248DD8A1|nr:hypothetical protein [Microvirgula aerodenitrificans]
MLRDIDEHESRQALPRQVCFASSHELNFIASLQVETTGSAGIPFLYAICWNPGGKYNELRMAGEECCLEITGLSEK